MADHVILIAVQMSAPDRDAALRAAYGLVPPGQGPVEGQEDLRVEAFWVAEDDRLDNGDHDSAVFVHRGDQERGDRLLRAAELQG